MNETIYWIIEYLKVLPAYAFIMFIWPSVVFGRFLKGKTRTFRFAFCVVTMINLINTVVLLLGTCHLLNVWVIRVLFYGAFVFAVYRALNLKKRNLPNNLKYITSGTMGKKTFMRKVFNKIRDMFAKFRQLSGKFFEGNAVVYIMLIVAVIYGMLYFTWNGFLDFSYAASDMYVHHEWIYYLVKGESFGGGIYPEGMHCFIYMINALFGIKIYSALMYVEGIHVAVILVSAYVFFKQLFKWKYSPVLAVVLFLVMDVKGSFPILGMSRMAWTLPQEFAYPCIFICAAYLIEYLRRKEDDKSLKNAKLYIFVLALAGTVSIHFYATIMAFFLCLMSVIPLIPKLFKKRSFLNLFLGVLIGVFIAFVPMLAALATGKEFQGSINWALNLIKDSIASNELPDTDVIKEKAYEIVTGYDISFKQVAAKDVDISKALSGKKTRGIKRGNGQSLSWKLDNIYTRTYVFMHGVKRAPVILIAELVVLWLWLILKIGFLIAHIKNKDINAERYDGYLMLALVGICFNLLNSTPALGLPELLESGRICALSQLFSLAIFFVPLDLIMSFPVYTVKEKISAAIGVAGMVSAVAVTVMSGNYHSYLYYCLGRYNAAVDCAFSIMKDVNPYEFTIVSTTEEYYQIIDCGYHEELVDFVNAAYYEDSYTLPTKYVFIFVEKKPIKYPHMHFASGPKWLALNNYDKYLDPGYSVYPDVVCSEISDEMAETDYGKFVSGTINEYSDLSRRTLVESKAYAWCSKFDRLYPGELKTYYEDDSFVCYYFEQNQRNTYELAIQ